MEKKIERIPYEAPRIERLGTLTELTKAGQTQPGRDAVFAGSVNIPRPRRPR